MHPMIRQICLHIMGFKWHHELKSGPISYAASIHIVKTYLRTLQLEDVIISWEKGCWLALVAVCLIISLSWPTAAQNYLLQKQN